MCLVCLLCGKRTKCSQNCAVDASGILEEYADDFLDVFCVRLAEGRGGIDGIRMLNLGAVDGLDVWVGLVLRSVWCLMLEAG